MTKKTSRGWDYALSLFPIVFLTLSFSIKKWYPRTYFGLFKEDSWAENLQVIIYLVAGVLALHCVKYLRHLSHKYWFLYVIFGLGLLFIGMEEISWGQRIFNIQTPEIIAEFNTQDELTIHNLEPFQKALHAVYMVIGIYGAFSWLALKPKLVKWLGKIANIYIPNKELFFYFFPVFVFYAVFDFLNSQYYKLVLAHNHPRIWGVDINEARHQEVFETILAFGFLALVWQNFKLLTKLTNQPCATPSVSQNNRHRLNSMLQ
jgi:hypothetical protein